MFELARPFSYEIPQDTGETPLEKLLRELCPGASWNELRRAITTGKVEIDGTIVAETRQLVRGGSRLGYHPNARRPTTALLAPERIVYLDSQLVVVNKPAGISTVPFDEHERGTLDELLRRAVAQRFQTPVAPLGVVHRIDKETSGLLVFSRTHTALRHLKNQFRFHTSHRRYLALVLGAPGEATYRSRLVANRGDGRRGSTDRSELGREAVTHVKPLERLGAATLIECRLETGRTHQIRIHLAEAGFPLLGEPVYGRPEVTRPLAPRLLLHAAELGFEHPINGEQLQFSVPLPPDFEQRLAELRQQGLASPSLPQPRPERPQTRPLSDTKRPDTKRPDTGTQQVTRRPKSHAARRPGTR